MSLLLIYISTLTNDSTHHLSLHDALPISLTTISKSLWEQPSGMDSKKSETVNTKLPDASSVLVMNSLSLAAHSCFANSRQFCEKVVKGRDRKSTRLNSSHVAISYAVFCLKK